MLMSPPLSSMASVSAPFSDMGLVVSSPAFVHWCSQMAPPLSVLVSMAPLPTIQEIRSKNDVGGLPLLPYSCMTANCGLWTLYGMLQDNTSIWAPNLVGMLLAVYYCSEYIRFAPKEEEASKLGSIITSVDQHVHSLTALGAGALAALASNVPASYFGQAAVLLCIALFASPLATLKTVMDTKSASTIPLPFTLCSVAACFCWSVTGCLELHDANVILPNTLGLMFGLAQVFLKLLYRDEEPATSVLDVTTTTTTTSTFVHLQDGYVLRLPDTAAAARQDERTSVEEPAVASYVLTVP